MLSVPTKVPAGRLKGILLLLQRTATKGLDLVPRPGETQSVLLSVVTQNLIKAVNYTVNSPRLVSLV